jgi:hypothetical protein
MISQSFAWYRVALRVVCTLFLITAMGLATACGRGDVNNPVSPTSATGISLGGDNGPASTPSTLAVKATAQTKVDVCHRTEGTNNFVLITIAAPSVEAHLNHGDGRVGDPVPGQPGTVFDANCTLAMPAVPLTNGDFETGNFDGWTLFTTEFGGIGTPEVVLFDTNGDSVLTRSARFNVGQIGGPCGIGSVCPEQGGGIFQSFSTGAGQLFIAVDIAAQSEGNNGAGGLFTLFLDGVQVDSFDFGDIGPSVEGPIERHSLSASLTVAPGLHELRIQIERAGGVTTFVNNYVDNVTLAGEALIQ